jgi:hypothetical protein
MSKPRLSRAMQRHVQAKAARERYIASPEYQEVERGLEAMVRSLGWEPRVHKPRVTQRIRRGKLVTIPEEWRGVVTHPQTIKKRNPVRRRTRKNRNKST